MRFLAISGSLRARSSNTRILEAAASVMPEFVETVFYRGLSDLPHFNPDLEVEPAHPAVAILRRELQSADAVMICSPEYAHGVPGSLKNALDWVVGSGEMMNKPVALLNASARSTHAQVALEEIVRTMAGRVVAEASIVAVEPDLDYKLRLAMRALAHFVSSSV